jgi:dolichol-phosphate mannosyltransferase
VTDAASRAILDAGELPAYTIAYEGARTTPYCVLIPVLDEGERIRRQLAGMQSEHLGCDVIVVDGGSTDGSTDPAALQSLGVSALLVKTGPGRLSAQLRVGLARAMERGYDGVVTIDGNGKDDYRAVPRFAEKLAAGFDVVQGSRYMPGGVAENTPLDREIGVRFLHAPLISVGAGFRYTDSTNGFRAFSRRFLLDPRVRPFRAVFDTYNLHYYLAVRGPRLGFAVCEIPVARRYPARGPTPSKIGGLAGKLDLLRQASLAVLGAYDP